MLITIRWMLLVIFKVANVGVFINLILKKYGCLRKEFRIRMGVQIIHQGIKVGVRVI